MTASDAGTAAVPIAASGEPTPWDADSLARACWRSLRPEDVYHLGYLAVATAIVVAADAPNHLRPYLTVHAALATIILLGGPAARRWPALPLRLARDLYHLPAAAFYYRETAALHRSVWGDRSFDEMIVALDERLFGGQPSVAFARAFDGEAFSSVMHAAYLSYYGIVVAGAVALWCCRDARVFHRAVHAVVFTMLLCYTMFIAFPVVGPSYHWPSLGTVALPGAWVRSLFGALMTLEEPTGAFPSSHVAVTTAFLVAFWRYLRPAFWIALAPGLLLIVSTVYVRAHYASDAIAGVLVGVLAAWAAERLRDPAARALGLTEIGRQPRASTPIRRRTRAGSIL